MKDRGLEVDSGIMLEQRLNKCPVFDNIEVRQIHTPVGRWARCKRYRLGNLSRN